MQKTVLSGVGLDAVKSRRGWQLSGASQFAGCHITLDTFRQGTLPIE